MHEERRSAGGTECGCNFAGDKPTLAHAGHNHASGTAKEQIHAAIEGLGYRTRKAICEIVERLGLDANHIFAGAVHGKRMVAEGSGQWLMGSGQWLVVSGW